MIKGSVLSIVLFPCLATKDLKLTFIFTSKQSDEEGLADRKWETQGHPVSDTGI